MKRYCNPRRLGQYRAVWPLPPSLDYLFGVCDERCLAGMLPAFVATEAVDDRTWPLWITTGAPLQSKNVLDRLYDEGSNAPVRF